MAVTESRSGATTPSKSHSVHWLVECVPLPAALQDSNFRFVAVNQLFCGLLSYDARELIGQDSGFLHHPDDLPQMLQRRKALQQVTGGCSVDSRRAVAKDGRTFWVNVRSRLVILNGNRYYLNVVQDSVDSALRERVLLDTSEMFRVLFEDSPVATTMQDAQYRMVQVNRAYCQMTGYSATELIGMDPIEFHFPEDRAEFVDDRRIYESRSPGASTHQRSGEIYARRLRHKNGKAVHYRMQYRDTRASDGKNYMVVVLIDTGVEMAAQAVIEEQAHRIKRNFELAPVGMVIRDDQQLVRAVNRAFTRLTGYRAEEVIGKKDLFYQAATAGSSADDARRASQTTPQVGRVEKARLAVRTRDGREVWTDRISTRIDDTDGKPTYLAVVTDVTAEHLLSEELKRVVLQQGALLRSTAAGVVHIVADTVVRVNSSMGSMLKRDIAEMQGRPVADLIGGLRTWNELRENSAEALAEGGTYRKEIALHRPGLSDLACEASLRLIDTEAPDLGMILTLVDITDLKAQQAALQRRNAELEALIENNAVAIAYLDAGRVARCNRLFESMVDAPLGGMIGRSLLPYVQSEDAGLLDALSGAAESNRSFTVKAQLLRADGSRRPCFMHTQPVDRANAPTAAIFVAIDLSDQQAAEIQLAEVRERFQRFAEVVDELAMVVDSGLNHALYCNGRLETILGSTLEQFYRDPQAAFAHVDAEDRVKIGYACAHAHGMPQQELELRVDHPTRGQRLVRLRVCSSESDLDEVYCTAEDVTAYRRLEQQRLNEALEQRDMLVREVHHRIKNNLQGVAGLLQQIAQRRPELSSALDEIANQIQAIAQVHGLQVRDTNDLAPLRIVEAMLQNLGRNFGVAFQLEPNDPAAFEGWVIPEQEAVPLALVINELGTNAIKHRAAGGRVGARLEAADESLELVMWNQGRLPDNFDFAGLSSSPSGLGLVKAMLPRRGTRLRFEQDGDRVNVRLSLASPVLRRHQ